MIKQAGGALLPAIEHRPRGRDAARHPAARRAARADPVRRARAPATACRRRARSPATSACRARPSSRPSTRLTAEGLIVSTHRRRHLSSAQALVAHAPPRRARRRPERAPGAAAGARRSRAARERFLERPPHVPRAFTTALPAFDAFPMALWSRHVAKHWRPQRDVVLGYGEAHGFCPLRRAIAAHLRANRGIPCEPRRSLSSTAPSTASS